MPTTPHWLNQKRLSVYPKIFFVIFLLVGIGWLVSSKSLSEITSLPLRSDFLTFWTASKLALTGHPADAYNIPRMVHAERTFAPESKDTFAWFYPPAFYLLAMPLALLPYSLSFALFMLATLALYLFVLRRITTDSIAMWCLAAFPGVWICLLDGQNGFLTAAIAAAALLLLPKRPALAGVCIGLLAIKPHLAVLFPVALIAIAAWRALAASAATAIALTGISSAIVGPSIFKAWLASLGDARQLLESGALPWAQMPTPFAMLRILHLPVAAAYALQSLVALAAASAVWYVWRRSPDWPLRGATLMSATFLVSPYVFHYDLVWLAFPLAWLTVTGLQHGWLSLEREVLVLAWILPLAMAPLAMSFHLQPGPLVLCALLWITVRRAARQPVHALRPAPPPPLETPRETPDFLLPAKA